MNRHRGLCAAVVLVVLTGCATEEGAPQSPPSRGKSDAAAPAVERPNERRCSEEMPEPTYLPAGFEDRFIRGPAPGSRPADGKGQVIFHLRGDGGRAIEVRRPGTPFTELALGDDAPTIRVLGGDTPNFGPIEPGGNQFIVQFVHPKGADIEDRCSTFSLNEVGLPLAKLKKVAKGLLKDE